MDRYRWNILGLCETRWKNFGETTTAAGHKVFSSGKEDKHEHSVSPVSSKLITIHLRPVSFNITVVQAYAPTPDNDDNEMEEFFDQLQNIIGQTPKEDILAVQGNRTAKVGKDAYENWQGIFGPFC